MNPSTIFIHYLNQLEKMLIKIEASDAGQDILTARLSSDMLPFISQVRTTINFALRAICPLVDMELVNFTQEQENYAGLKIQLKSTVEFLAAITDEQFANAKVACINETAGFNQLSLPKDEFLNLYALPNFFFHLSMAYAIARQCGVPLSKGDYDGYHQYPAGFSFN